MLISLAMDLGGPLGDATAAEEQLSALGFECSRVARAYEYNAIYRLASQPFLALPDEAFRLDLGSRGTRAATRRILISPQGIGLFQVEYDASALASPTDWHGDYNAIQARKNRAYRRVLQDDPVVGGSPNWTLDGVKTRHDDGGLNVEQLLAVRDALRPCVSARGAAFPMMASRWVMLIAPDSQGASTSAFTRLLAELQKAERLEALDDRELRRTGALACFASIKLGSFGGTGLLAEVMSADDDRALRSALLHAQATHHSARSWLWSIDYDEWMNVEPRVYEEQELKELGRTLLRSGQLQRDVNRSMLDVTHANIGFNSTLSRRLVEDLYRRFDTPTLLSLVNGRLQALEAQNQLVSALIDRGYQEAQRKHSERLQLLFAGAVAAALLALLPALLAIPDRPSGAWYWYPITVGGWALLWLAMISGAAKFLNVKIDFRRVEGD